MILRLFLSQINLFRADVFFIHKVAQIVIIRKNKDFMFAMFIIVVLSLIRFNNSDKLAISSLLLSSCQDFFLRKEEYYMLLM